MNIAVIYKDNNFEPTGTKNLEKKLIPVFGSTLAHLMVQCILESKSAEDIYTLAYSNCPSDKKQIKRMGIFMAQMIENKTISESVANKIIDKYL